MGQSRLYASALPKWFAIKEMIEKMIETETVDIPEIDSLMRRLCSFCYDALEKVCLNNPMDSSFSTDGTICGKYCKIDKTICGAEKSLLNRALRPTTTAEKRLEYINKIIDKMKELRDKFKKKEEKKEK